MFHFKHLLYAALIGSTLGLCACGDDEDDYYWEDQDSSYDSGTQNSSFTVIPSRFDLTNTSQTATAYLQNADNLYIEVSQLSWAQAERYYDEVHITVSANTGNTRTGNIYLTSGTSVQTISITQQGGYSGDGNDSGNNNDNSGNSGNNSGGNNGGSTSVPAAPSYVSASPDGPSSAPFANIAWASVPGATSYMVYRSTSAYGSYSLLSTVSICTYFDETVKYGSTYYYKVKAKNSAGTSDFSDYAECQFTDNRKPGPVKYGNCTVSGTTMTLRWSLPTDPSYGKPTKAILRVMNPISGVYADVETLSPTATSASFAYGMWIDNSGYVRAGIILENENGTGGGTPKIYDTNNKKWIN
ncbi:MAG: hypothetical protein NC301_02950 [Bacteroides sp.]|nr:hypothetical protein [Bacteroides sp.]MCM1378952.1 hypothetical protein [Bacteroides sp.]MCM1445568.1 hypothetical protein [Prevotella sp.]